MTPGIYYDMPAAEYHADPAISKSGLMHFAKSPAHYQAYLSGPRKETGALRFGSAYDHAIFEPKTFDAIYKAKPSGMKFTTTAGKAWQKEHADKIVIPWDEYMAGVNMMSAIRAHPLATKLLDGKPQVSIWWHDLETGVLCRARLDIWPEATHIIADHKTTRDAGRREFGRQAGQLRYDVQASFYYDGMAALGESPAGFVLVAQDKEPPYDVACYEVTADQRERARDWYRGQLARYARCLEADEWPGYPQSIQILDLPGWV